MAMEIAGTDMAQVGGETKKDVDSSFLHEKENGKLDKDLGSHEEPVKGETNNVSDFNLPKDAIDEWPAAWPAAKQVRVFYFVRHQRYDDPKIQARIDSVGEEIQKMSQSLVQISGEMRAKKSERADLMAQLRTLRTDIRTYKVLLDEKKREQGPMLARGGLCSSEEELDDLIYSLQYRIQHESIPLSEEKQIVREIKQLEGTREKVIANAAARAKIEESQKEAIPDELMSMDLDGVKKEHQVAQSKIKNVEGRVKALDAEIKALNDEWEAIVKKRDAARDSVKEQRARRDEGNALFFESRSLISQVRVLKDKKDVKALEELSPSEVEKFMSQWNSSKSFRDDYEKRILPSLDFRQLSRDGRIRNPDETPLLAPKASSEPVPVAKDTAKRPKEDSKPAPQKESLPMQKVLKETGKNNSAVAMEKVAADEKVVSEVEEQQQKPAEENVVDEAKLKELQREEEMAKAKQAMERKKKLAEKAAAKAAVKAQKQAEKKLKEREKKLKKKDGTIAAAGKPEEALEVVAEAVAEPETVVTSEEAPTLAPLKEKVPNREKTVRHRNRPRGGEPLPKAILKRRKPNSYWMWAAVAAALVLLFLALGYFYMF